MTFELDMILSVLRLMKATKTFREPGEGASQLYNDGMLAILKNYAKAYRSEMNAGNIKKHFSDVLIGFPQHKNFVEERLQVIVNEVNISHREIA